MKVVILAGGLPSTIADYHEEMPKPMLEIGERPLLWHIMKLYSYYGYNEFVICAGYKSEVIKKYFTDYYIYQSDITIDLETNQIVIHNKRTENWQVTVLDTGIGTGIAERIRRTRQYMKEEFFVTYGDCVSNIDLKAMAFKHRQGNKTATVGIARPAGRNKILQLGEDGAFLPREEKSKNGQNAWTNACTMLFSNKVFAYLDNHCGDLIEDLFETLSETSQIDTFKHEGFWLPVETRRDRSEMERLWQTGSPPWKVWT